MKSFILLVVGVWLGMVFGLSFLEAPLKFQAPGITTKLGLGIGRLVFSYSQKIQCLYFLLLIIYAFKNYFQFQYFLKILILLLTFIMTIQTFYLLPALDERASQILNDIQVPSSKLHLYFVVLEIFKLIILTSIFFKVIKNE